MTILSVLGHSDIALFMVKTGSIPGGVDSRDRNGTAPTFLAPGFGIEMVASALIKAGADINLANNECRSTLFLARQEGHLKLVRS